MFQSRRRLAGGLRSLTSVLGESSSAQNASVSNSVASAFASKQGTMPNYARGSQLCMGEAIRALPRSLGQISLKTKTVILKWGKTELLRPPLDIWLMPLCNHMIYLYHKPVSCPLSPSAQFSPFEQRVGFPPHQIPHRVLHLDLQEPGFGVQRPCR